MQATLDGIAEVQAPAQPPDLAGVCLVGFLASPAIVRTDDDGEVQTELVLHQHQPDDGHVVPICVTYTEPEGGSFALRHEAAIDRAKRLPAGAVAVVVGHGLRTTRYQSAPALRIVACTHLAPDDSTPSIIKPKA